MPDATPATPPYDAVFVPRDHFAGATLQDRMEAMRAECGPLLGLARPYVHTVVHPDGRLVAPTAETSYNFPKGHALSGQSRYDWEDAPGKPGVSCGRLRPEATEITGDDRRK